MQEHPWITTKVFKSGNSQAVRIPKEFQLSVDEVLIQKVDDELHIRLQQKSLYDALKSLSEIEAFEEGRNQPEDQIRERFE